MPILQGHVASQLYIAVLLSHALDESVCVALLVFGATSVEIWTRLPPDHACSAAASAPPSLAEKLLLEMMTSSASGIICANYHGSYMLLYHVEVPWPAAPSSGFDARFVLRKTRAASHNGLTLSAIATIALTHTRPQERHDLADLASYTFGSGSPGTRFWSDLLVEVKSETTGNQILKTLPCCKRQP